MSHETDIIAQIMGRKPAVVVEEVETEEALAESTETLTEAEDGHRPTELEKEFAARDAGANLANFGDDEEPEMEPEEEEEEEAEPEEVKESSEWSFEMTRQEVLDEAVRRSFRGLNESVELTESVTDESSLDKIIDLVRKDFGYEIGVSKSTLGGGAPTYFIKVAGPKDTWKNGIALNSPLTLTIRIDSGVMDMTANSYQVRNAKAKLRKTKYKDDAELVKKLTTYFQKNKANFEAVLSGN